MKNHEKIVLRHMAFSESLEDFVRKKCENLKRFNERISDMRVIIDAPRQYNGRWHPCQVTIAVLVGGKNITASHIQPMKIRRASLRPVIEQAFSVMIRQLEDCARRQRGDVRHCLTEYETEVFPIYISSEIGNAQGKTVAS